jgi:hypothetical protein
MEINRVLNWKVVGLLFFINTTLVQIAFGQISNVDRIHVYDSAFKKYEFSSQVSLSNDKQQTQYLYLNTGLEVDRNFQNKYLLLGIFSNTLIYTGATGRLNKGAAQVSYRDRNSRKVSAELYGKLQWNQTWGMQKRLFGGCDLVIRLNKQENAHQNNLYGGIGLFYEFEEWNWNGVPPTLKPLDAKTQYIRTVRLSNFWKVSTKISKTVDFNALTYIMFPVNENFKTPRTVLDCNFFFKVSSHVNAVLHWDGIYDENLPVPIGNFFYSYTVGLQGKF